MKKTGDATDRDRALIRGYEIGETIEHLCSRLGLSRSGLYRCLARLNVPAREPLKRSFYRRKIKQYPRAHPIVKQLLNQARQNGIPLSWLAEQAGICPESICAWGNHSSPTLVNIIAVANCLGFDLRLVRRKD